MSDDDGTVFLNNNDANKVYRIVDNACAKFGCTAEQCNQIANQAANEIGKAEARSKKGQLGAVTWEWFKKWWVTLLSAIGAVVLGWIAWALDFIKIGGS